MSQITDAPRHPVSGAKVYARLDRRGAFVPNEPANAPGPGQHAPIPTSVGELLEFDLAFLAHWIRAGIRWIMVLAMVGVVAGLLFGVMSKPRFTATTSLVVEPTNLQVLNDNLFPSYNQADAQLASVESRLRILTSGNVLTRVVAQLDLVADPEFVPPPPLFSMGDLFGGSGGGASIAPEQVALENLTKRVAAKREDKSFVVALSASSEDPNKSVLIARTIVEAFQAELADSEAVGASRAAESLTGRLEVMKQDVGTAEAEVEAFKLANDLQSSSGELVNAQSLTQINAQRNQAEVTLAQAQSRYDELLGAGLSGLVTNQTLQSPSITALRQQYSTLKQQLDSESTRLGPRHPTLASLQAQVDAINGELDAEAQRLVDAAKAEVAEATALVASLDGQASAIRSSLASDNSAQVELRALERDAQAKASVYEAFLSRVGEISERERIDATNVRVISDATPPSSRSYPPRTVLLMLIGAIGGAFVGGMVALVIGWRRNRRAEARLRG